MTLLDFLAGAVTFGFLTCALFFFHFWRRTRDSLFQAFAIAFLLLGAAQALLALGNIPLEERSSVYAIRLAAFVLIFIAVLAKNRR